MDTLKGKGYKVTYNFFGDTNQVAYYNSWKVDSIEYFTYQCDHLPDTIDLQQMDRYQHNTKHEQYHIYTQIFVPSSRRIIYDTVEYIKDSVFQAKRKAFEKSGTIY
jgi:hypothetical protein